MRAQERYLEGIEEDVDTSRKRNWVLYVFGAREGKEGKGLLTRTALSVSVPTLCLAD